MVALPWAHGLGSPFESPCLDEHVCRALYLAP